MGNPRPLLWHSDPRWRRAMSQEKRAGPKMPENGKRANSASREDEERERMLSEQLPQVRYIARRIHERLPRHVPLEDLVHAGVVGLIDALHKFNREKHVQFASYAKFRI